MSKGSTGCFLLPFVVLNQLAESAVDGEPLPGSLREIITAGEQLRITGKISGFFENCPLARCIIIMAPLRAMW